MKWINHYLLFCSEQMKQLSSFTLNPIANFCSLTKLSLMFFSSFVFSQHFEHDITGYWQFDHTNVDTTNCIYEKKPVISEESETGQNVFIDLYLLNDSIYWIDYPCNMQSKSKISIQDDSLIWNGGYATYFYTLNKDTLTVDFDNCISATYYKVDKNEDTLSVLLTMEINPKCVSGVYYLITEFEPEYPAYDQAYVAIPPIKVPAKINLQNYYQAKSLLEKNSILLTVNGKERIFHLVYHDFCNWDMDCDYYLVLEPGGWWNGDPFTVQYRSKKL